VHFTSTIRLKVLPFLKTFWRNNNMSLTTLQQTARSMLGLAARTLAVLTLGVSTAWAAGGGGAPLTCTISPAPGSTTIGAPITFTANTTNAKGQITYAWTFSGPATPQSSTSQSQAVTYSATGTFAVSLHVITTKSGECTDNTTVTVTGGTGNTAPTANDDSYNATVGQALNVGAPGVLGNDTDPDAGDTLTAVLQTDVSKGSLTLNANGSFTYTYTGAGSSDTDSFTYVAQDNHGAQSGVATVTITISEATANGTPVGRGDAYATPVGTTLTVAASRVSGVLYNDYETDANGNNLGNANLTAQRVSGPANGTLNLNPDGSFTYTPNASLSDNDNDSFTYVATDGTNDSAVTTVNINILSKQTDFKILMNYELGMHCTGFEFAYCCVLPPYNSILAQVVKPQPAGTPVHGDDFPRLLAGDPNNVDGLGRPTVVRDAELDGSGNFTKYFLEYYHDAQPRHEGQGAAQSSTLISDVEGKSMFYTSTRYDSACRNLSDTGAPGACPTYDQSLPEGGLVTGAYEGAYGVVLGDGDDTNDPSDNYANGWLNHFYIYSGLEGANPNNTSAESAKIRLGMVGGVVYPANSGAALQPMGPTGNGTGIDNVLTFSGDTGTVVYTQMKVLENLPIMLTSPRIWEALGLPLTPFEDSINFFADPGAVDEDSIRPYVEMKAALHVADCTQTPCAEGPAVIGSNGKPVIGFGTAPIDIPNCERCHSVPAYDANNNPNTNSPSYIRSASFSMPGSGPYAGASLEAVTAAEKNYWDAYYDITTGDSDWYSRLKGAAINMLALHDFDNGTSFTANWPACTGAKPTDQDYCGPTAQNTRLGKESVICQKCHADNVIAVVKSAYKDAAKTLLIKPITEAIHHRHREVSECDDPSDQSTCGHIDFADAAGRSGGCQGCHPAHRSDGVMDNYPITRQGQNFQAGSDNRLAAGGCFVGRDVHSNALKDVDGAETPAHLNAVGQWLSDNVFNNQDGAAGVSGSPTRGLWCTNCHTQLSQEIWKTENCVDEINGNCASNPRGQSTLAGVASAVGTNLNQAIAWLDPTSTDLHGTGLGDFTHAIWKGYDPALPWTQDASLAIIEVNTNGNCSVAPYTTSSGGVCVAIDGDGDPSVRILDFCTTSDCESAAQAVLNGEGNGSTATVVPFSAATDARDHWLAAGEPHCADCHAAPYVEPSGGNVSDTDVLGRTTFKPPFNYPRKASLMRYSTGHQGVTCQGCHESIHGLYPVTPTIDATSYAQAAALNADGSHGPLKCGTCHTVGTDGRPTWIRKTTIFGGNFDDSVTWAHTYTDNASPLDSTCQNCHADRRNRISETSGRWLRHSYLGRVGRQTQDKAEIGAMGHVAGDPAFHHNDPQDIANTVCTSCHSANGGPSGNFLPLATCGNTTWKQHLVQGRLSPKVWEFISRSENNGSTCGW
jgi:VCBS repeat-containing protein